MIQNINNTPQDSGQGDNLYVATTKINNNFDYIQGILNDVLTTGSTISISQVSGLQAALDSINNELANIPTILQDIVDINTAITSINNTLNSQNISITELLADVVDLQSQINLKVDEAPIDGLQYARQDGSWTVVSGGTSSQNLQQVTDNGNTTTNSIEINTLKLFDTPNGDYGEIILNDDDLKFINASTVELLKFSKGRLTFINGNDFNAEFNSVAITGYRTYTLPNADGTFALTSDLTDRFTTGGTYNSSAGTITFTTNSGSTYAVTGITNEVITLISDGIAGTAVTGSTNQTRVLVKSYLIPANTFEVGDIMEFWAFGSKVGSATAWYVGCSKNTSNTLAGSTELVRSYSNNAWTIYLPLQRVVNFPTASTLKVSNQSNALEGATGFIQSTITFDTTIDNYLLFTVTPVTGGTGDLMNIERVLITKSKYKTTI